jgi:hypothetical protein
VRTMRTMKSKIYMPRKIPSTRLRRLISIIMGTA